MIRAVIASACAAVTAMAAAPEEAAADLELPDPLTMADGKVIQSVEEWQQIGRPQTVEWFRQHIYGRTPIGKPADLTSRVVREDSKALDGKATVKELSITFSGPGGDGELRPVVVLPNDAKGPVPAFLLICNRSSEVLVLENDNEFWPVREIVRRGYAAVAMHVGDVRPDTAEPLVDGVQKIFPMEGAEGDSWGTIAAWGWGASRVLDVLEMESGIDATRVAVLGHSRGGKAALWCGAEDQRFALVISNNSGCTGAALARRKQGERVKAINDRFPHWFCENYKQFNDREDEMPVDQHQLLALMAPRLTYVASASEDAWADPQGEFLAAWHASPVFQLHGHQGLVGAEFPEPGQPLHEGRIGYHLRAGKHDLTKSDWQQFMDFADKHW